MWLFHLENDSNCKEQINKLYLLSQLAPVLSRMSTQHKLIAAFALSHNPPSPTHTNTCLSILAPWNCSCFSCHLQWFFFYHQTKFIYREERVTIKCICTGVRCPRSNIYILWLTSYVTLNTILHLCLIFPIV